MSTSPVFVLVVVGLLACKHEEKPAPAPAPKPPAPAPHVPVRLAAVGGDSAQLVEIDGANVKTVATFKLPSSAVALVWTDKNPLVLLQSVTFGDNTIGDPKYDGIVGALTASGFAPLAPLPAATWVLPQPRGATRLGPYWKLEEGNDEAWLGRCEWGGIEDGGHCDEWVWARLGGKFALSARMSPPPRDAREWPKIAPPAGYTITFSQKDGDDPRAIMTCETAGKKQLFPDNEDDPKVDRESLRWISNAPPLFVVDEVIDGFMPTSSTVAFEGCTPSTKYGRPAGVAGPDGLFALATSGALSIRRDGKELASLPGAERVVFAPGPAAVPDSYIGIAFATLEHQLAGDASMLAHDAVVLAPTLGAPLALPASVTAARIPYFTAGALGDAIWFAAEIDAGGRTYRTMQVIDAKSRKVLVASFAPLAPLRRVEVAPAIADATPAGPLAKLLADPRAAAATRSSRAVFGTDPGEAGTDEQARAVLASWSKLALTADQVREVHTATWGYALGTVHLAKAGGAPYRMSALAFGAPDEHGTWQVVALHYLSL